MADEVQGQLEKFLEEERALWAADGLVDHVRRQVHGLVASAAVGKRWEMYKCVKAKLAACEEALLECAKLLPGKGPGGGSGPDCPKGYHEENGTCIIDPPDSN